MFVNKPTLIGVAAALLLSGAAQAATVVVQTETGTAYDSPTSVRADTGSRGVDLVGATITATYANQTSEVATWAELDPFTAGEATGNDFSLYMDFEGFDLIANIALAFLTIDLSTSNSIADGSGRSVFDQSTARDGEAGDTPSSLFGVPLTFDNQSYPGTFFFGSPIVGDGPEAPDGTVTATYSDIVSIGGNPAQGDLYSSLTIDFTALSGGGFLGLTNFESDVDTFEAVSAVPLPAGLPLLLAGLGGIGLLRRARKG